MVKTEQGRDRSGRAKERLDATFAELRKGMVDAPEKEKDVSIGAEPRPTDDEKADRRDQGEMEAGVDQEVEMENSARDTPMEVPGENGT